MKQVSFYVGKTDPLKSSATANTVARIVKFVASVTVVLTVLMGASGCNPAIQELQPLDKSTSSATPTPSEKRSNGVEIPEILSEPTCNYDRTCRPNDLWNSVKNSAPMYMGNNIEKKKALYIATALTLVGPGTQNTNTARENIVSAILAAEHSSHFACFHYQMRNFVSVNEKNKQYMETAAKAFDVGLPELAAFIMTHAGPTPSVTMTDYGSQKGEGFEIKGKDVRDLVFDMADIELPTSKTAIEQWAKAYEKSAEFGLEILNQRSTDDLQSRIMYCSSELN